MRPVELFINVMWRDCKGLQPLAVCAALTGGLPTDNINDSSVPTVGQ
jgi:hypothetical protein